MLTCEHIRPRLDAFRTSELSSAEQEAIAAHLADCADCGAVLADLRRLAEQATSLRLAAPPAVREAVLAGAADGFAQIDTDLGPTWIAFGSRGITLVHLGPEEPERFAARYARRRRRALQPRPLPERYAAAVRAAAAGEAAPSVPVDLGGLGPFEQTVLTELRRIPRGEVRTYAWLAGAAGQPRAVRAVGNAMARNPVPLLLPCHRVVPTGGGVGNYGFGSAVKRALLEREGVPIVELDDLARRGVRVVGCTTTGVYCCPTCRDLRRSRLDHRRPFASPAAAAAAGYRPCQHCRPALAS
jgi:O-6-methylguanine DNA methyltransferase